MSSLSLAVLVSVLLSNVPAISSQPTTDDDQSLTSSQQQIWMEKDYIRSLLSLPETYIVNSVAGVVQRSVDNATKEFISIIHDSSRLFQRHLEVFTHNITDLVQRLVDSKAKELTQTVRRDFSDVFNNLVNFMHRGFQNTTRQLSDAALRDTLVLEQLRQSAAAQSNLTSSLFRVVQQIQRQLASTSSGSQNADCQHQQAPDQTDEEQQADGKSGADLLRQNQQRARRALNTGRCIPLLIQQNIYGLQIFDASWAEYKAGFGDASGNFWIGNELLHRLASTGRYKLRFDLQQRFSGRWFYAEYSTLVVESELMNYTLHVDGFQGNTSWDALDFHNDMMFSTYDRDNDENEVISCAHRYKGGFWYRGCNAHCGVNTAAGRRNYFYWNNLPDEERLQLSRMSLQCK